MKDRDLGMTVFFFYTISETICIFASIENLFNMAEEYSYERRIVCFIDILGFSNLVKDTEDNGFRGHSNLLNVCEALNMLDDFRLTMSEAMKAKDVRSTQFSDSVVISFPWNEEDNSIVSAILLIKNYQVFLIMQHGVILRGGITIGDIIHNEKMIVGPAMIDAYTLESKYAINPRIIIDYQVVSMFGKAYGRCRKKNKNIDTTMINIDDDNLFYIDYFNFSERDRTGGFFYHNDYLHLLKRMVAENEDNEDDRIREKYLWMNKK